MNLDDKTRRYFRVTYEIITPESAEHGDFAESGFIFPHGGRDPVFRDGIMHPGQAHFFTLKEALTYCSTMEETGLGNWFHGIDPDINYHTGEEEFRNLHPPRNISDASYARLCRALRNAGYLSR